MRKRYHSVEEMARDLSEPAFADKLVRVIRAERSNPFAAETRRRAFWAGLALLAIAALIFLGMGLGVVPRAAWIAACVYVGIGAPCVLPGALFGIRRPIPPWDK